MKKKVIPYLTTQGKSGYRVVTEKPEKKSFWKKFILYLSLL